jgi:hypothetical protein
MVAREESTAACAVGLLCAAYMLPHSTTLLHIVPHSTTLCRQAVLYLLYHHHLAPLCEPPHHIAPAYVPMYALMPAAALSPHSHMFRVGFRTNLPLNPHSSSACSHAPQPSLEPAAPVFVGIIIFLCIAVAVVFIASLVVGLQARAWLQRILDARREGLGLVDGELVASGGKMLHMSIAGGAAAHSTNNGGGGEGGGSTAAAAAGKLVAGSVGARLATWRLVLGGGGGGGGKAGGASSKAAAANISGIPAAAGNAGAAVCASEDAASPSGASSSRSPGPSTVARGAGGGGAAAAAAGTGLSASIDIGALGTLRSGVATQPAGRPPPLLVPAAAAAATSTYVAVDLNGLSGPASARSAGHHRPLGGAVGGAGNAAAAAMTRANSAGAAVPGGVTLPLQAYASVRQWLRESESAGEGEAGSGRDRAAPAGWAGSDAASRSLQDLDVSPRGRWAPGTAGRTGLLAAQRLQLLQQLQAGPGAAGTTGSNVVSHALPSGPQSSDEIDVAQLRSVSETEEETPAGAAAARRIVIAQQQQQRQQRRRVENDQQQPRQDSAAAAAAAAAPGIRHQPYYALWGGVAGALQGQQPSSTAGSGSAPSGAPSAITTRGQGHRSSQQQTRAAGSGSAISSSVSSSGRVRPSPFAAPLPAVTAAIGGSGSGAAAAPPAPRSASLPAQRPSQQPPFAQQGRHSVYYSLWQAAMQRLSEDQELSPAPAPAPSRATCPRRGDSREVEQSHVQRSATAPPSRQHGPYVSMWQAVAGEVADGPSALGAPASAAANAGGLPPHVAAALAASLAPQPVPQPSRRASPFAAAALAVAAAVGDGMPTATAASSSTASSLQVPGSSQQTSSQQHSLRRRRSARPTSHRGRRSSAAGGTALSSGELGSDASAYLGPGGGGGAGGSAEGDHSSGREAADAADT